MRKKKSALAARPGTRPGISFSSQEGIASSRFLFFGGKGGVGKTTAAAAVALYLLKLARDPEQILLLSTDPAHSLSDSLGVEIGDRLVEVAHHGGARLIAHEMNASNALAKFAHRYRPMLAIIAERGTLLDTTDINELLNLSLPGMDEVMALFELSDFDRAGEYSRIVVDTAPSGHTSRLLGMPAVFEHWIGALNLLGEKHRFMVSHFSRGRRQPTDEVDLFLNELRERLERLKALLYNPDRCSFTLVTIPEAMSVEESSRYYAFLRRERIPVTDLIINRVEIERNNCDYCRARALLQKPWLKQLIREFGALKIHSVPLLTEARGLRALRRFAQLAWETTPGSAPREAARTHTAMVSRREPSAKGLRSSRPAAGPGKFAIETRQLLIFGGKGGVGKTTMAAAAALALAKKNRNTRVLIFSIDPAHSLSDSFDENIGELKRGVAGVPNLDAMEIDPTARFEEFKARYRDWADRLFESLTANSRWEIQFDHEAIREIVALAPPGIDEISALGEISDLVHEGTYESIVLDTAPTGHLIRFLELPGLALSWVHAFMKLALKYSEVMRGTSLAEELLAMSRSIKRVAALLADRKKCEFIAVAIPEQMSLEETERLARRLERLKVPMQHLVINNVVPRDAASACGFCSARRRSQLKVIEAFKQGFRDKTILIAGQQRSDIRGPRSLSAHFTSLHPLEARTRGAGLRKQEATQ